MVSLQIKVRESSNRLNWRKVVICKNNLGSQHQRDPSEKIKEKLRGLEGWEGGREFSCLNFKIDVHMMTEMEQDKKTPNCHHDQMSAFKIGMADLPVSFIFYVNPCNMQLHREQERGDRGYGYKTQLPRAIWRLKVVWESKKIWDRGSLRTKENFRKPVMDLLFEVHKMHPLEELWSHTT